MTDQLFSQPPAGPARALPFPGPLDIGGLRLDPPLILAPLAGLSSWPMRMLSRRFGASLCVTEMVSAVALARRLPQVDALYALKTHPRDRPLAIQLFGARPDDMAEAARGLAALEADIIDLNMGCPVRKVMRGGAGAALLQDLPRAAAIVRAVRAAVRVPLTIKFRIGWGLAGKEGLELARICEGEGVDAIVVHGRSRAQGFAGEPDLPAIREIVAAVKIPVIGNGGIKSFYTAERMLLETGCRGIMPARGARGNPWLFAALVRGPHTPDPTPAERAEIVLLHLQWMLDLFPEKKAVLEMRKHLAWYSRGLARAVEARRELQTVTTIGRVRELVEKYFIEPEPETPAD
jgi:nifR3 family TIM-barrel protein